MKTTKMNNKIAKYQMMWKKVQAILAALFLIFAASAAATVTSYADEETLSFEPADDYTGKTVILQSNDVHGQLRGYANIAGLRDELEKRGADVILADCGDFMQGSPYVNYYKGSSAVTMMNTAGYDVATLGNHEFDYAADNTIKTLKQAQFKVICADLEETATGKNVYDDSTIIDAGDIKVGFLGMDTPATETSTNPKKLEGYQFNTIKSEMTTYEKAQQSVDKLKADGADVIICLAHLGVNPASTPYTSYELLENTEGIDLVLDGHSHTVITEGKNGEPIMSTGSKFNYIGVAVIDEKTCKVESRALYAVTEDSFSNEEVLKQAQVFMAEVDGAYAYKVGESEVELNGANTAEASEPFANGNRDGETNLGDFATDAVKWFVLNNYEELSEEADNVVVVLNGGGNRDWIHKGEVTRENLNTVWPFGNSVVAIGVKGSVLLNVLEASTFCTPMPVAGFPQVEGIDYTIDTTKEYDAQDDTYPRSTYYGPASIQRVTINNINGKPFDPDAEYKVLTIDFCASGGDTCYEFTKASSYIDTGTLLDEVADEYLEKKLGGVIGKEYENPAGRIHIITKDGRTADNTSEDAQPAEKKGAAGNAAEPEQTGGSAGIAADGKWGPLTTRATQKALSEIEDGLLGPDTVRAMQKKVGAEEDGIWGPETTRAMQRLLGITEDGKLGPETVKAWQEWCNEAA